MTNRKLRVIENAILLAFPLALFAGCAGSDIKPAPVEKSGSSYSQSYTSYENPLPEDELTDISMVYTVEQNMSDTSPVEQQQGTEPVITEHEPDISWDDNTAQLSFDEPATQDSTDSLNESSERVSKMAGTGTDTIQTPESIVFYFDTDKHQLQDEQRQELQQHAEYLLANPNMTMVISGHADVRGSDYYNQSLSEQRALAIYDLLVELGVPEHQLMKRGFGEAQPMHDENNWAENRRVELEFQDPMMLTGM
ncbi:MAG: OmpA family protein [Gammaproteobacteria bacterium]|jgi:peptidoglycan-associated lipoprotein